MWQVDTLETAAQMPEVPQTFQLVTHRVFLARASKWTFWTHVQQAAEIVTPFILNSAKPVGAAIAHVIAVSGVFFHVSNLSLNSMY